MRSAFLFLTTCLLVSQASAMPGKLDLFARVGEGGNIVLAPESTAALSEDGRFVFIASVSTTPSERGIASALVQRGTVVRTSRLSTDPLLITQMALSPDGRVLAAVGIGNAGAADSLLLLSVNPLTGALSPLGSVALGNSVDPANQPAFNLDGGVVYVGDAAFPGRLFTCDASPTGGIDPSPLQTITLGSQIQAFKLDLSGDGTTLAVAAADINAGGQDLLIVYDVSLSTGQLTERGRYSPGVDLGWDRFSNPAVSPDGTRAFVIDAVETQVESLDITTTGTFSSPISTETLASSPLTLTLSEQGNVLAAVLSSEVAMLAIDQTGIAALQTVLSPPNPLTFSPQNNIVLSASGTLGALAAATDAKVAVFETSGALSDPILSARNLPGTPGFTTSAFDFRRLLVLSEGSGNAPAVGSVLEVAALQPSVFEWTSLEDPLTGGITTPAMTPSGLFALATSALPSGEFVTISALTEGPQTSPLLRRPPPQGYDIGLNGQGGIAAVAAENDLYVYNPTSSPLPIIYFGSMIDDFSQSQLGITESGDFLYAPNATSANIWVIDTANLSGGSPAQIQPIMGSFPIQAALSPDELILACVAEASGTLHLFDRNPVTGLLSNERFENIPNPITGLNNLAFLSNTRAVIGDAVGSVHLFDLTNIAIGPVNSISLGTNVSHIVPIPNQPRFAALVPEAGGGATVVEVAPDDSMAISGGLRDIVLTSGANLDVTYNGLLGVLGFTPVLAGPPGIALFEVNQRGFTSRPLAVGPSGTCRLVSLDEAGRTVASNDIDADRLVVHRIGYFPPPRLTDAILLEDGLAADGVGQAGEALLLTFDRAVRVPPVTLDPGDLFFFQSANPGSGSTLVRSPRNFNQAILALGTLPTGIIAPGDQQGIDLPAIPTRILVDAMVYNVPAVDLGLPRSDDAGVDIRRSLGRRTTQIGNAGGFADLPDDLDFAFTAHRLRVPPTALGAPIQFTLSAPDIATTQSGFPNAVRIESDVTALFSLPATLGLQFDPSMTNRDMGLLPQLVQIVQIIDDAGVPTPVPLPGPFEVDVQAGVVSTEISDLDPADTDASAPRQGGTVGTFATLPINPVDERTINIAPEAAGAAALPDASVTLTPGTEGAYTLHAIEFPNYVQTTDTDPSRTEVTIRTSTLFDRTSYGSGQSFPTQSGAIFTVETLDDGGNPLSFTDPVNITVQFVERPGDDETDTVDFDSVRGHRQQMRMVWDAQVGVDVDFELIGGDRLGSLVTLLSHTPLTGSDGARSFGAVVDPSVTVVEPTLSDIINHLLGIAILTGDLFDAADDDGSGLIDAADLVRFINAQSP